MSKLRMWAGGAAIRSAAFLSLALAGAGLSSAAGVSIGQLQLTNAGGYQRVTFYNLTGQGNGGCDGALYRVCNGVTIRSWSLTLTYSNPGNSNPTNAPSASTLTFTGGPQDAIGPYSGSGNGYTGSPAGTWEIPLAGVGGVEPSCPPCDYQITRIEFSGTIDSSSLPLSVGSPGAVSQFGADPNIDAVWTVQSTDSSQPGYVDYWNPEFFAGLYDVVVSDQTSGPRAPELAISMTHSGSFVQGQSGGAYSITVANSAVGGPAGGTVTVTDIAPGGMTLTSMSGAGWTCTALPSCTRSDALPPGAAYPPITALVNVAAGAGTPLLNQASVSGGGSAGAVTTDSTAISLQPAVLRVAKRHAGSFVQGQNGATYSITVSNASGAGATNGAVTVTESLPGGMTLVSMTGPNWTCAVGGNTCTRSDTLAAGAGYDPIVVTVNISAGAASPQVNQVSVSGGGSAPASASDPTVIGIPQTITFGPLSDAVYGAAPFAVTATATSNLPVTFAASPVSVCTLAGNTVSVVGVGTCAITANQAGDAIYAPAPSVTQSFQVAGVASLSIAKRHSGDFTRGQNGAAYLISVSNTGTSATVGAVTVTEDAPAGLTLAAMYGDGWTCTSPPSCSRVDSLAAGASYPSIVATVNVAADAPSPLVNQASVSGGGSATAGAGDSTVITAASPHTITAGSASAAPGGGFRIPVTLRLAAGTSADVATFGLQIAPVGAAPPLAAAASLSFTKADSIPNEPFETTGGAANTLGIVWSSLGTTASGDLVLGFATGFVPANAAVGQAYAVTITGADAGLNGANVAIGAGPSGTLTVANTYLIGDVDPHASDAAPDFGNGALDIFDLIQVLFAVNNVPGYRPAPCSDRFDAMDLYPSDTPTVRGGNGRLDIYDLIQELFRVNGLDSARPVRPSLGGSCAAVQSILNSAGSGSREAARRLRGEIGGSLVFGAPEMRAEGSERVPVYLDATRALNRIALTFGLGDQRSPLKFASAGAPPSLASDRRRGIIAAAWTQGLSLPAGTRLLLGYIEGPAGVSGSLTVFGVSAAGLDDGREVRIVALGATPNE